jgi:hypothetical protein
MHSLLNTVAKIIINLESIVFLPLFFSNIHLYLGIFRFLLGEILSGVGGFGLILQREIFKMFAYEKDYDCYAELDAHTANDGTIRTPPSLRVALWI